MVESCPVPLVIAGSPRIESELDLLKMVRSNRGRASGVALEGMSSNMMMQRSYCIAYASRVVLQGMSAEAAIEITSIE